LETGKVRISFRESSSMVIIDDTKIPKEYKEIKFIQETIIDNAGIKEFLKHLETLNKSVNE